MERDRHDASQENPPGKCVLKAQGVQGRPLGHLKQKEAIRPTNKRACQQQAANAGTGPARQNSKKPPG